MRLNYQRAFHGLLCLVAVTVAADAKDKSKKQAPEATSLQQYIEAARGVSAAERAGPGSSWSPNGSLLDMASDLRARHVNDIVTIVVREQASAISEGRVSSNRDSSAKSSVSALAGAPGVGSPLPNLLGLETNRSLDGQGTTSRRTLLTATLAARVVERLPNGNLVVEGERLVGINNERQLIKLRGVIRPFDISVANTIASEQVALLELNIDGKGVVGDAIRRPNFLYRMLLGILPF